MSNRVAFVTGSSRGIGRAIALTLSREGFYIVVASPEVENNELVAGEIRSGGGEAMTLNLDISSQESVKEGFGQVLAAKGGVDVLVNNAGITRDQLTMKMTDEEWDKVLAIDLKSVFLCTRAVLRPMLKQRSGRIISMSSVVGIIGNAGQANYAAAKAGIIGFTKTIAKEVASRGITVNAVAPGFIDTPMTQVLPEERKQALMANIPLGYLGTPRDIADTVAFLASEEARYITGQVISVDGGISLGKL